MPGTASIGASGYNFGQGGYGNYQRIQLPGMGGSGQIKGQNKFDNEDSASHFRRGILFYFGNCQIPSITQRKLTTSISVATGASKNYSIVSAMQNVKSASPAATQIATIVQQALAEAPAWAANFAAQAANEIKSQLPIAITGMLSKIGYVPGASNIVSVATNLKTAIQKTRAASKAADLAPALRSGEPLVIVDALRKQLSHDAKVALGKALYNAAQVVAAALTAGAALAGAQLVDAIAGFLGYIWDLFNRIFERILLEAFFKACKLKYQSNDKIISDTWQFRLWFSPWVGALPIIASHCICSKITGSYFGFLSALVDDTVPQPKTTYERINAGLWGSRSKLEVAYSNYVSLQREATEYARDYYYHFSSHDKMVQMSLTATESGGVDLTNGAAAQSVGYFRRFCMWAGSKLGVSDSSLYDAMPA
jgi:hypothetical protein